MIVNSFCLLHVSGEQVGLHVACVPSVYGLVQTLEPSTTFCLVWNDLCLGASAWEQPQWKIWLFFLILVCTPVMDTHSNCVQVYDSIYIEPCPRMNIRVVDLVPSSVKWPCMSPQAETHCYNNQCVLYATSDAGVLTTLNYFPSRAP